MVRAFRTFICTLAVGTAFCQKTDEGAKIDTVTNALSTIGSLLGQHAAAGFDGRSMVMAKLLSATKVTPGLSESLSGIISSVISDIENDVDKKITNSFESTQNAITSAIDELRDATDAALGQKTSADDADRIWATCVADEKAKRVEDEEAEVALKLAEEAVIAPCGDEVNSQKFAAAPFALPMVACAFDADNCDEQLQSFDSEMASIVPSLTEDYDLKLDIWTKAKASCDAAWAEAEIRKAAKGQTAAAWQNQRLACISKHEDRSVAMCFFGNELQRKCEKAAAYTGLLAEVDQVNGGEYSQPDREAEWKTTSTTKCMLSLVAEGETLDEQALADCEEKVIFAGDGRELVRLESDFADLTSPAKYTCEEQTIPFADAWVVPSGLAPPSSEYTQEAFEPAIDLTVDAPPFTFCV